MRDPTNAADWALVVLATAFVAALLAGFVALLIWVWSNAQDKRDCRRAGGQVVAVDSDKEWHCVGARPESP